MLVLSGLRGGGAERVAVVLAGGFAEKGHEVLFASDKKRSDEPFVYPVDQRVEMAKCFVSSSSGILGRGAFFFKSHFRIIYKIIKTIYRYTISYWKLRKVIRKKRPDVVLAFMHPTFLNTFVAAIGTGSIVIATEHNAFERPGSAPMRPRDFFFKFMASRIFKVVTVLTEADKVVIGTRLKNIRVMPNPLAFNPVNRQELAVGRRKEIVTAGRLDVWHYKGFDILIRAWAKIAKDCEGWRLNIAGQGGENALNFLQGIVKECHVEDSVLFSGFHADLDLLFRQSEIFVLSSRYEGFGLVLIEAMSQGCACIACDYKGRQREIIRNESEGLCVPPDDIDRLAEAMSLMIADEVYRNSVRIHGVARSKAYDVSAVTDHWLNLFNELTKKK